MMLALLIYSYATGIFSSRKIQTATHENVATRYLCADTHPDHDSICKFRRDNKELLSSAFHQVLELAAAARVLKVGDLTVAIDGTKLLANASKITGVEAGGEGPEVYAAMKRQPHGRSVGQLEKHPDPPAPPKDAPLGEIMTHRLSTAGGKALYGLRKQTVEPVFGIIKEAIGFRRFMLRGQEKAGLEWTLVSTAYNLKRLFGLGARLRPA